MISGNFVAKRKFSEIRAIRGKEQISENSCNSWQKRSMTDIAIRVENLSKQYPSLRQAQYKRQAQDKPHRRPAGTLQDDPGPVE
jgi:hypothetical protein